MLQNTIGDKSTLVQVMVWCHQVTCHYLSQYLPRSKAPNQCRRKTFMVHQTFVWWALYIPYKFVKSPIRHLGLAIGNVWHFSPTLLMMQLGHNDLITVISSCGDWRLSSSSRRRMTNYIWWKMLSITCGLCCSGPIVIIKDQTFHDFSVYFFSFDITILCHIQIHEIYFWKFQTFMHQHKWHIARASITESLLFGNYKPSRLSDTKMIFHHILYQWLCARLQ